MTTYYWASAISGAWTTAADWTPPGGPAVVGSPGFPPPQSPDDAVFATGSASAYTVTVGGESASTRVSGDHVNFVDFRNGEDGYGGAFTADGGAVVTIAVSSSLDYAAHDGYGGGPVLVNGARVVDYGSISAGSMNLQDKAIVSERGAKASIATYGALVVDGTSALGVSSGATLTTIAPGPTIDGALNVTGKGSTAFLFQLQGAGHVNVANQATVTVAGDVAGTIGFGIGNAGNLAFSSGVISAGTTASFTGNNATLTLDGGTPGEIVGFGGSNAIVVDQTVTGVSWSAGAGGKGHLFLRDGNATVETLNVQGNYAGDTFNVAADGSGATKITVSAPKFQGSLAQLQAEIVQAAGGNATLSAGIAAIGHDLASVSTVQEFLSGLGTLAGSGSGGSPWSIADAGSSLQHAALDVQQILSDGSKVAFLHASN